MGKNKQKESRVAINNHNDNDSNNSGNKGYDDCNNNNIILIKDVRDTLDI
ncbi:hypothetical protein DICPUDRAFT_149823 [Dictyostelium purpureum]|uniref:Uncharacterized protein n=1 Tax=Dictyostelium purpureum TaxID=5786 RepID=F0ZER5_DICPU|nr:uncharacterized protein DICPUDRAFT_149823 [Dictyostelium purpureum]EGC37586.1 hypothetical protein DICPUDRAFT_149823 [Dictyostelium purpureum]|eukprot:XP_003285912.1 hypothetical protein DICPUDRAFT_149823 [Dictyostelium purpureum]